MLVPYKDNLCSKNAVKMLSIKINDSCNAKCSFCVNRGGHKTNKIDIQKISEQAIFYSEYKTIIITGGEPFLNFDKVLTLASSLRKHKDRIVLNTNGTLLSPDKINDLNGLIDELQVSIHHFDPNKNSEIFGQEISFENIKESLKKKSFIFSVNSTFNNHYSENEFPIAINKMVELCKWLNADRLRLTELKKVDETQFVSASKFFREDSPALLYSSNELITKGCTYYYYQDDIHISVKRLCQYAKGKNATAFSCCFIDQNGQKKIDVDTIDTFKVIYPDGLVTNDWIFNKNEKVLCNPLLKRI